MSFASNDLPHYLYHSSSFYHSELMPGFKRSGVLVNWDEVESNEWLYATTSKESAIELGLASSIEKSFKLNFFKSEGDKITIVVEGSGLKYGPLVNLKVYLYTFTPSVNDEWIKNNNPHNNLDTEWKTQATVVRDIVRTERVDLKEWLRKKKVEIQYVDKRGRLIKPTFLSL